MVPPKANQLTLRNHPDNPARLGLQGGKERDAAPSRFRYREPDGRGVRLPDKTGRVPQVGGRLVEIPQVNAVFEHATKPDTTVKPLHKRLIRAVFVSDEISVVRLAGEHLLDLAAFHAMLLV